MKTGHAALAAGAGLVLAWAPPLRGLLEASMLAHMLLQLPLIAAAGFVLGRSCARHWHGTCLARTLASFDAGGATGIVFAAAVMVLWMVPRLLDGARLDAGVDALKFASLAAAGAALAASWPRCPALARGLVHLEGIAMLARFGWGFLAAEDRLCASYLLADQRLAGAALIAAAGAWAAAAVWPVLFGSPSVRTSPALRR